MEDLNITLDDIYKKQCLTLLFNDGSLNAFKPVPALPVLMFRNLI